LAQKQITSEKEKGLKCRPLSERIWEEMYSKPENRRRREFLAKAVEKRR